MVRAIAVYIGIFLFWGLPLAFGRVTPEPADRHFEAYLYMLRGKSVALVVNQTSMVHDSLLPELLVARGVAVKKIFVPEHGFRGREDAGAHIGNSIDSLTGLPILSSYGRHKKPDSADLADVDILVYDLQDVGVRFYTYISTLQYCMEACATYKKKIIVLDRPDPNGFYVDGPVLEEKFRSFVGMQCIPVVYGMTCGEYAEMLVGEHWLSCPSTPDLQVIPCTHYSHKSRYLLPVAPSPNLRTAAAIYAYPSLCLFEGTSVSVGRGTDLPFTQYGSPDFAGVFTYTFTPVSLPGASQPPYKDKVCYGERVDGQSLSAGETSGITLRWLIKAYHASTGKDLFFTPFFKSLSGTDSLEAQIKAGYTEEKIKRQWQKGLMNFKAIRKKYLLYADFE